MWGRKTSSITDNDATSYAESLGEFSDTTRHNIRGALMTLLKFYVTGRLAYKKSTEDKPPETYSVKQVKDLFSVAEAEVPEIIPALVMWFFCGLRPGEVEKLASKYINIPDGLVIIDGATSKRRWWRNVTIPDVGLKWLRKYPPGEKVAPSKDALRTWREKLMSKCKQERWPADGPRHTFGTAHYNHFKDVKLTMYMMGHFDSPETFLRHYKGYMSDKDAKAYFDIKPFKMKGIIRLPKVA
jgi:integrase